METFSLFFGILLLAVAAFLVFVIIVIEKGTESGEIIPAATIGALAVVLIIVGAAIIHNYYSPTITPMDVYRGKTTLEITYRDGVAIDSTVVWKEEIK